jgi:hypothetical protein
MSISGGAATLSPGAYVLLRVPQSGDLDDATTAGSQLPPTSTGNSPQHFAFIRNSMLRDDGSFVLEVYCQLSFSAAPDSLAHVMNMPDADGAKLIPLPPLSDPHPPPELFGPPLHVEGWKNAKPAWLNTVLKRFIMPATRSVSSFRES